MNEALHDWLRTHATVQTNPNPNKKPNPITPIGLFALGLMTHLRVFSSD